MSDDILKVKELIDKTDAIVIGAGSGLSTAAGYTYSGSRFYKYFEDFIFKYNFIDMYTAGFYNFQSPEEYWAYWSRYIFINRYMDIPNNTYINLFDLVKNKNYFVITTNVDHSFQRSGFAKNRIFYTQGDYGLFQCSTPCHNKTYDNEELIRKMLESQNIKISKSNELIISDNIKMTIDSNLIPKCPVCGEPMIMNLRSDDTFVEDDTWHKHDRLYEEFINANKNKKILFLELGVGYNTPSIIKYPFEEMTYKLKKANLVRVNKDYAQVPEEIENKAIGLYYSIDEFLDKLKKLYK